MNYVTPVFTKELAAFITVREVLSWSSLPIGLGSFGTGGPLSGVIVTYGRCAGGGVGVITGTLRAGGSAGSWRREDVGSCGGQGSGAGADVERLIWGSWGLLTSARVGAVRSGWPTAHPLPWAVGVEGLARGPKLQMEGLRKWDSHGS